MFGSIGLQADSFRISIPDENNFQKAASGKSGIMTTSNQQEKYTNLSLLTPTSLAVRLHGA